MFYQAALRVEDIDALFHGAGPAVALPIGRETGNIIAADGFGVAFAVLELAALAGSGGEEGESAALGGDPDIAVAAFGEGEDLVVGEGAGGEGAFVVGEEGHVPVVEVDAAA